MLIKKVETILENCKAFFCRYRRIHRRCSINKAVLKNFALFTGKCHLSNEAVNLDYIAKFLRTPISAALVEKTLKNEKRQNGFYKNECNEKQHGFSFLGYN